MLPLPGILTIRGHPLIILAIIGTLTTLLQGLEDKNSAG
jgi:hypothetical protein